MLSFLFLSSASALTMWIGGYGPDPDPDFVPQDFQDCLDEARADFQSGVVTLTRLGSAQDEILACQDIPDEMVRIVNTRLQETNDRRAQLQARILKETPSLTRLVNVAPAAFDPWSLDQLSRVQGIEITFDLERFAQVNVEIVYLTQHHDELQRLHQQALDEVARYDAIARAMIDQVCAGRITIPEQPLPQGTCVPVTTHRFMPGMARPIR